MQNFRQAQSAGYGSYQNAGIDSAAVQSYGQAMPPPVPQQNPEIPGDNAQGQPETIDIPLDPTPATDGGPLSSAPAMPDNFAAQNPNFAPNPLANVLTPTQLKNKLLGTNEPEPPAFGEDVLRIFM